MKAVKTFFPQKKYIIALLAAFVLECSLSPKWTLSAAAWLVPVFWVFLARRLRTVQFITFGYIAMYLANLVSFHGVFPFPMAMLAIYSLFTTLVNLIPYLADKYTAHRLHPVLQSLILPSSFVIIEYLVSYSPSGTWGSMAYTQADVPVLMQSGALTGIWGMVFLIYWTGPVIVNFLESRKIQTLHYLYLGIILAVSSYGFLHYHIPGSTTGKSVRIGSVTANQLPLAEALYRNLHGKEIRIHPKISQSDPLLAEINQGYLSYLKDPDGAAFAGLRTAQHELLAELFRKSAGLAAEGAEIILWSEAAAQTIKSSEGALVNEASAFAREHEIWLVFPAAVFHPGDHAPGVPFLENKLLIFDPEGTRIAAYYKNVPVEGIEPSFGGDGTVPVFEMNGARIATVICYDADFPQLIAQAGRKKADVLLVPSSDWFAIGKAHAAMARFRAVENGVSLFRPAGNGQTTVTDPTGRILLSTDYYSDPSHTSIMAVPLDYRPTFYAHYPNAMVWLAALFLITAQLILITGWLKTRTSATRRHSPETG